MDKPLSINVVKVGGAVVESAEQLAELLRAFSNLHEAKVLVHGGGRTATDLATQLGIQTHMVGGRRVTDADMLRVVTMVYAGLVNKNLVAQLQSLGIQALGLSGADLNMMRSHQRPPVPITHEDGTTTQVNYGFVGDIDQVNGTELATLAARNIVPVLAPITHNGHGQLLNTNADTIAAQAAQALAQIGCRVTLTYCFQHTGVLADPNNETSVIPHITPSLFEQLKTEGIVSGGMIPKIQNALAACRAGVDSVIITRANNLDKSSAGTIITL